MYLNDAQMAREAEQPSLEPVQFGRAPLTIEDICAVAAGIRSATLDRSDAYRALINAGHEFLANMLRDDGVIYGVTTGYGDSCTVKIPADQVAELPLHITRFHGCGLGRILSREEARAVVAIRLASLAQGHSGVRYVLLERLLWLLQEDIMPLIPAEGSVGASGDLTPLSYVGALLVGERDALYHGEIRPAQEIYDELGVTPLTLQPKEGLALMNGTAVMTALACLAYKRADYLGRLTSRLTSMAVLTLKGNAGHFDERLFLVKPHPGQVRVAARIRSDLNGWAQRHADNRLQDRYSLRCAPHVIGVLEDALPLMRQFIETELNSANDNPIIDAEEKAVLHGGHFYGGHIAFAMDSLKNCIANLADLMDRQMALLVDPRFNNGMPANLSGATPDRASINHGFKAIQIGMSAWTAEALKNTMPASVFSRSTECHNQDKVSMGTIAARDCLRVVELTEQVAAALTLALTQAFSIRQAEGDLQDGVSDAVMGFYSAVSSWFEMVSEDRALEQDLHHCLAEIRKQGWSLYSDE